MNYGGIIAEVSLPGFGSQMSSAKRLVRNMRHELEMRTSDQSIAGMPTHFVELDTILGGLHNGELIVVSGRPGMGKSIFLQSLIRNICRNNDARVAMFSLEAKARTVMRGIVAGEAKIDANKIRDINMHREETEQMFRASDMVAAFKLWIDDTAMLSLPELCVTALRLKQAHGIDLVIVDHLQLLTMRNPEGRSREQEIAEITRRLKELAKAMDVPIVLVSQMSRKPETRPDHRPLLSDLRDSGSIEEDADVVLLLHRPEHYRKDERPGEVDILVAKQRNGPTGAVRLAFIGAQHRFENLTRQEPVVPDAE